MDTVFHWGMFRLPSIVKQRHVHLPFKQLIRHALWESVQLSQPTQYRIEAGVMVGAKTCECLPAMTTGTLDQRISNCGASATLLLDILN